MNSRFYFKQYQVIPPAKEGEPPTVDEVEDSIDIYDIHRTRTYKDGGMIILLKDGHEIDQVEPLVSTNKSGAKTLVKKRVWVQSEIRLSPKDADRLKKITDVSDYYGRAVQNPLPNLETENTTSLVVEEGEGEAEIQDNIEGGKPPQEENILENTN